MNVPVHVIVISETWLKCGNTSLFNIRNFDPIYSCRESSSGGLAVFIRKTLSHNVLENLVDDGLHHISIEIKVKGLYYEIHGVYRPPCFEFNRFHDKMETWLQKSSVNRPCLIVGDMNVPINLVNNNVVVKYRNLLESFGFICTNSFITRPLSSNILDHIICQSEYAHRLTNYTVLNDASDHLPIISSFNLAKPFDKSVLTKKNH